MILWDWRHRDRLCIGFSIAGLMPGHCNEVPMGFPWTSLCAIEHSGLIVEGSKAHAAEGTSAIDFV